MRPHRVRNAFGCTLVVLLAVACGAELPLDPNDNPMPIDAGEGVKPLANHVTDQVTVGVNNYVLTFQDERLSNGVYKGTPALFAGGLSYGNAADAAFVVNTQGLASPRFNVEFLEAVPGSYADHQTLGLLTERVDNALGPSNPLGLAIVRETYTYSGAPDDDYVIVKYSLVNTTGASITGLHVGEILDTDVSNRIQNVADFDVADQASRTTSAVDPVAHGHVLLSHPVGSYRSWTQGGDPVNLAGYYTFLSGGIVGADPFGPTDVRQLLTTGPVDIPAGGSLAVFTALVGGDDTADLSTNIAAARAKYAALPATAQAATGIAPVTVAAGRVKGKKDLFSMEFTFDDAATAGLFDGGLAFCGKAPVVQSDGQGATVTAKFDKADLDPRLRNGDVMSCGGVLTDGRVFAQLVPARFKNQFISTVTQLTTLGDDWMPTWSPDGTMIAFSSDRSGMRRVWTMNVETSSAMQVTAESGQAPEYEPDWSPDGSTIVFRRAGAIYTVPAAGGVETQLTVVGAPTDRDPRWSPDGSQIVFRRGGGSWKMGAAGELGGSPATRISDNGGSSDLNADWGSDGRVYFSRPSGTAPPAIFSVDPINPEPGTAAVQVTPVENANNQHPAVSPDGSTLAFVSLTTAGVEIILQDLASGEHSIVLLDTGVFVDPFIQQNLEFSPDGTHVLFEGLLENVFGAPRFVFMADVSGLR